MQATALFPTDQPGRYLAQLCQHFAHKVPVERSETEGECRFACGIARLATTPGGLLLTATAGNEANLQETQAVIENHLLRFAFRTGGSPLIWTR